MKYRGINYSIIYDPEGNCFIGHTWGQSGCVVNGRTKEEAIQFMEEAIDIHIENADGLPIFINNDVMEDEVLLS